MRKILNALFIFLGIILLKLILTFSINEIIIWNYNNKIYNTVLIKLLYPLNFSQSYIAYYNDGNILYKKENYDKAIQKYKKSLDENPPQKRVCDIRINLSLAMIKNIDSTDYKTVYNQLEDAKSNLYNNNCASAIDNNGYSQDAEKLEEEIKNLQDQLNNNSNKPQSDQDKEERENEKEQEDYSDIEEQLKEIEKKSNSTRQEDMTSYENMGDYSYYSGKSW